jgi:hypothetical protein
VTTLGSGGRTAAIGRISEPLTREPQPATAPAGGTALLERPDERLGDVEEGDHDRFAHYVRKSKILESAVNGTPVRALCGKKWVPGRDPSRFPVCPTCKEIYERMKPGPKPPDVG